MMVGGQWNKARSERSRSGVRPSAANMHNGGTKLCADGS